MLTTIKASRVSHTKIAHTKNMQRERKKIIRTKTYIRLALCLKIRHDLWQIVSMKNMNTTVNEIK